MIIIIGIVVILFLVWFGYVLATTQNEAISRCFKMRKLHNDLLFGRSLIKDISDSELLSLSKPLFTHVGMGGIGPAYNPSFSVFEMIMKEIGRRRGLRV